MQIYEKLALDKRNQSKNVNKIEYVISCKRLTNKYLYGTN